MRCQVSLYSIAFCGFCGLPTGAQLSFKFCPRTYRRVTLVSRVKAAVTVTVVVPKLGRQQMLNSASQCYAGLPLSAATSVGWLVATSASANVKWCNIFKRGHEYMGPAGNVILQRHHGETKEARHPFQALPLHRVLPFQRKSAMMTLAAAANLNDRMKKAKIERKKCTRRIWRIK